MDAERWKRVQAALDSALAAPEPARAQVIAAECRGDEALRFEVERLVAAAVDVDAFAARLSARLGVPLAPNIPERPRQVGRYRLVELLGRGGMGVVYRAERTDGQFEHEVALKLLPVGFETPERVARFQTERQILARLRHAHIAMLLDGGVTEDGSPYFVMELVDGTPLDLWADAHALTVRDRVKLLLDVLGAVEYAHRNLVVHRDLKPGNILVAAGGTPKLLDFGIARVLEAMEGGDPSTLTQQRRPITPAYASPEQMRGEAVTTASDVYALGVLLYQVISGHLPYAEDEALAVAHREHTTAPRLDARYRQLTELQETTASARSTTRAALARTLQSDLGWIVAKALDPLPERRYAGAGALAEDLRRWLAHQPVTARAPSALYVVGRLVRRNRIAAGAAAVVTSLVIGSALLATVQQRQTARARDRAQTEAAKAREVTEFMLSLFRANEATDEPTDTVTARTLLARGAERVDALASTPEVQTEVLRAVASAYREIGRADLALPLAERALALERERSPGGVSAAASASLLGMVALDLGNSARADSLARRAMAILSTQARPDSGSLAAALSEQGRAQQELGNLDAADSLFRTALMLYERRGLADTREGLHVLNNLATVVGERGKFAQAEQLTRALLERRRRVLGEGHADVAATLVNLGYLALRQGRVDDARTMYLDALERRRRLHGPGHPGSVRVLANLGTLEARAANYAAADTILPAVVDLYVKLYGERHPSVATAINNLGTLRNEEGRLDEALALHRRSLAIRREVFAPMHPQIASGIGNVATTLAAQGGRANTSEAIRLTREALAIAQSAYGSEHPSVALQHYNLGTFLQALGDSDGAAANFEAALRIETALLGPEHPDVALDRMRLADVSSVRGRHADARREFSSALTMLRTALPQGHPRIAQALDLQGAALVREGAYAEAEIALLEAFEIRSARLGPDHRDTRATSVRLRDLYRLLRQPERAARYAAR